jgi:hypothetical protein
MKTRLAAVLWGLTFAWGSQAAEPLPLFDAHLHYNIEAASGPYPLEAVLKLFRDNRITGILANSRPNGYRHWLAELPREGAEKIAFRNAERLFRK